MNFTYDELLMASNYKQTDPTYWCKDNKFCPVGIILNMRGIEWKTYSKGHRSPADGYVHESIMTLITFAHFIGYRSANDFLEALHDTETVRAKILQKAETLLK